MNKITCRISILFLIFTQIISSSDDLCTRSKKKKYNIGFLIVATGKYIKFVNPLISSARQYFCTDHNVTYFVFTDRDIEPADDVVKIHQDKLDWPYATMMRFEMYHRQKELLQSMDYLFASDADMLFVNYVGNEILGNRVATMHPGFVGKRGSYETNPTSTACVHNNEGKHYFAGGFYGAKTSKFFKMMDTVTANIQKDLDKGFIAVWHDESHLNRYFIDHQPTVILSPSYCYPESWKLPYQKRLLALDKNHSQMRSEK